MTYAYVLLKPTGIRNDDKVSTPAKKMMVISILFGFYYIFLATINNLIPVRHSEFPLLFTLLIFLLGGTHTSLHRFIQKLLDQIFLGGWYDFRSVIFTTTTKLSQTKDNGRLSDQCLAILKSMHFRSGLLYLVEGGSLVLHGKFGYKDDNVICHNFPIPKEFGEYLENNSDPDWSEKILSGLRIDEIQ